MSINFLRAIWNRNLRERNYEHYGHRLTLPSQHMLDVIKRKYQAYDHQLAKLSSILQKYYTDMHAVDIGANIGDSAIAMRSSADFPIICIEGAKQYINYLRLNLRSLQEIIILESFVGNAISSEQLFRIDYNAGTARLSRKKTQALHRVKRLEDIITKIEIHSPLKLLKIDTDGFDFEIILDSAKLLQKHSPIIFFEYAPHQGAQSFEQGIEVIEHLLRLGYDRMVVYDNFGNLLFPLEEELKFHFKKFNCYLQQCIRNGGGVNYYDICAIHENDHIIFENLISSYQ